MNRDDSGSWDALESAWQSDDRPTETDRHSALIARLGRRRKRIEGAVRIGELLVALIFGSLSVQWLWNGPASHRVAGGFVLTVLIVVSILRRRVWFGPNMVFRGRTVSADAPTRFVESLLERNTEGQRAVRLGGYLLAVLFVFFAAWLPWSTAPSRLGGSLAFLALWTGGYVVALRASSRYLQRERRRLEALRDELSAD